MRGRLLLGKFGPALAATWLLLTIGGGAAGCRSAAPGAVPPALALRDLAGQTVNPFAAAPIGTRGWVFIFLRPDCPIANRYAPELQRLHEEFAPAGLAFWMVYPDPDLTTAEIAQHVRDYHLPGVALRDPHHELVRRAGATVTPEAAVFLPDGTQVYGGRIDDRYVDFGRERPRANRRELALVLTALSAGRKPDVPRERAVGCYIAPLP